MINFKEIAEKCLAGELSGTFITAFGNNWHSSYLQRYAILGQEMPEQYILGPGIIYNDMGQCTSNEKVKIVDFIPDTMKNFKEIAEKCLAGKLSGRFVCRDGLQISSFTLSRTDNPSYPYKLYRVGKLNEEGLTSNKYSHNDIIQFIPYKEMKQEQITINIPEGKVAVMEQTESEVIITWKEKELTYDIIKSKLDCYIPSFKFLPTLTSIPFYNKVEALRKLTNIRNYFGKPDGTESGFYIYRFDKNEFKVATTAYPAIYAGDVVAFTKREHAQAAIKILGDELKYLFEPW